MAKFSIPHVSGTQIVSACVPDMDRAQLITSSMDKSEPRLHEMRMNLLRAVDI